MIFSRTIDYALRIAVALAYRYDEATTTRDLAVDTEVPAAYLTKVIRTLARGGLVHSSRGVGGGHRLARRPAEISLFDVLQAVEDSNRIRSCPLGYEGEEKDGGSICGLHVCIDDAISLIEKHFAAISLDEFLTNPRLPKFCPLRAMEGQKHRNQASR